MKNFFENLIIILVVMLIYALLAYKIHKAYAGDITITENQAGNQTIQAGAVNNNENNSSATGGSASGGQGIASIGSVKSYAHGFGAAPGQDSVQLGSLIFGSIAVSTDTKTTQLGKASEAIINLNQAGLINTDEAKEMAKELVTELRNENTPDKCFGFVSCGKSRKIWNLFKVV